MEEYKRDVEIFRKNLNAGRTLRAFETEFGKRKDILMNVATFDSLMETIITSFEDEDVIMPYKANEFKLNVLMEVLNEDFEYKYKSLDEDLLSVFKPNIRTTYFPSRFNLINIIGQYPEVYEWFTEIFASNIQLNVKAEMFIDFIDKVDFKYYKEVLEPKNKFPVRSVIGNRQERINELLNYINNNIEVLEDMLGRLTVEKINYLQNNGIINFNVDEVYNKLAEELYDLSALDDVKTLEMKKSSNN